MPVIWRSSRWPRPFCSVHRRLEPREQAYGAEWDDGLIREEKAWIRVDYELPVAKVICIN